MRVISVNVGLPRTVTWRGRQVESGIWKSPVDGRVTVRTLNLDGDRQADLAVHGGVDKAVYAYPSEHYAWWRQQLPGVELPWGSFGENLTVEGLDEREVRVGDHYRIGSTELVVTQPRMPCFKLGIRFGRPEIVKQFLQSERSGFYFAVLREGEIGAGDVVERTRQDPHAVTVTDVVRLYVAQDPDPISLQRAIEVAALPESWRRHFRERAFGGS